MNRRQQGARSSRRIPGGRIVTPKTIFGSALELWLRADMGITLNGGNVSAWADQSGKGHDFSQGTAANQPPFNASDANLNGQASIGPFNGGSGKFLDIVAGATVNAPWMIFGVKYVGANPGTNEYIFAASSRGDLFVSGGGAGGVHHFLASNGGVNDVTDNPTAGPTAVIMAGVQDQNGGTDKLYKNAKTPVASLATAAGAPPGMLPASRRIGAFPGGTNLFEGNVAEYVGANRLPTAAELAAVFGYLGARYNIAIGP